MTLGTDEEGEEDEEEDDHDGPHVYVGQYVCDCVSYFYISQSANTTTAAAAVFSFHNS